MAGEPRLLDEVHDVMRLHHYSIHTERAYCEWIRRYVLFHRMTSREDLRGGEARIESFPTHLAVEGRVAPSTQNQAMNALVFLYKKLLKVSLKESFNAVRAPRRINMPVVMTREEISRVIPPLRGAPHLIVKLIFGSGLRIMEALRLRVQDIGLHMKSITVRSGKGAKDRITTFPVSVAPLLQNHLAQVKAIHDRDLARGLGEV